MSAPLTFIDNVWRDLHRLWSVRVAIAYAVFNGVAMVLTAFIGKLNPYFLLGVGVFVSLAIVTLRLIKQKDPLEPIG